MPFQVCSDDRVLYPQRRLHRAVICVHRKKKSISTTPLLLLQLLPSHLHSLPWSVSVVLCLTMCAPRQRAVNQPTVRSVLLDDSVRCKNYGLSRPDLLHGSIYRGEQRPQFSTTSIDEAGLNRTSACAASRTLVQSIAYDFFSFLRFFFLLFSSVSSSFGFDIYLPTYVHVALCTHTNTHTHTHNTLLYSIWLPCSVESMMGNSREDGTPRNVILQPDLLEYVGEKDINMIVHLHISQ